MSGKEKNTKVNWKSVYVTRVKRKITPLTLYFPPPLKSFGENSKLNKLWNMGHDNQRTKSPTGFWEKDT